MTDTTNAGPVLPEAPELRIKLRDSGYLTWSQARECDQNIRADIEAYGLQCWNACDEQVAGPMREELAAVLSDWNALVQAIGSPTNGGAVAHAKALQKRVSELEQQNEGLRQQHDRDSFSLRALCEHRDHLKSECEAKGQRVAELERDVAAYKAGSNEVAAILSAVREDRDRLRAENQALRADAERYRWLRDTMKYRACADVLNNHMRSGWDAAIDAARAAREGA